MNETEWLIAREIPTLRRFARALTRDPDRADDIVQDCLERALSKQHLWLRRGSLRSWLLRLLYNVFLNAERSRGRRRDAVALEDLPFDPDLRPNQEPRAELKAVLDLLHRLPAEQRDAIALVALEDLGYDEAAWILGVPVGTLRSRLSRGREALRRLQEATPGLRGERPKGDGEDGARSPEKGSPGTTIRPGTTSRPGTTIRRVK